LSEGIGVGLLTCHTPDPVYDIVDHLLAYGIVSAGIVVGSILLAADQQLGMEELTIGASPDLVDWRGVEVDEDGPGHVFAVARLSEEGLEGASIANVLGVGIRPSVGSKTVLEEVAREGESSARSKAVRG
jgi:hypothetical protein